MIKALRYTAWLFLLMLCALASMPSHAETAMPFSKGLLWKVEGAPTTRPSYVFGTVHSDDPRVAQPPAPVSEALRGARVFIMEMLFDESNIAAMAQSMFASDGRSLKSRLTPAEYATAVRAFAQRGIPEQIVQNIAPWAAMATLSIPPSQGGVPLDLVLHSNAVAAGKPAQGIETAAEQLAMFTNMSESDQIALLKLTLQDLPRQTQIYDELFRLYTQRDLAGIMKFSERHGPKDPALMKRMMGSMIDMRNQRMVDRVQNELRNGGAFVAVGAMHLPGENGVLNLLKRRGYKVSAVY